MVTFCCDYCKSKLYRQRKRLTKRREILDTKFSVVQCKACGLLSLFPFPTEEELKHVYHEYAEKKARISIEKIRKEVVYPLKLEKLKKFSEGNKLLDIGAGLGTFVCMAREFGFDAVGVEYEQGQCKKAQELWGVDLINDRIENVYHNFIGFDIMHLHHVLEHLYSPRKMLDIVYKILRPGGIALIEVPNEFFNIAREILVLIKSDTEQLVKPLDHLYFFSAKSLKRYIDKNRFSIVEFNQYRPRRKKLPIWERIPKDCYRLLVGSGGFFEVYIRKIRLK